MKKTLALSFLVATCLAHGQATVTDRLSSQRMTYVYGGAGDVVSADTLATNTDLLTSDLAHQAHVGEKSGTWAGQPYSGNVAMSLIHFYTLDDLNNLHVIQYNGTSDVSCGYAGIGGALADSMSPGNELILGFTTAKECDYRIFGELILVDNALNSSNVYLQRHDGVTWGNVYTTWELPGFQGPFLDTGTIPAGVYRIGAALYGQTLGNDFFHLSGNYHFLLSDNVHPARATVRLGKIQSGSVSDMVAEDFNLFTVCKFFVPNQTTPPVNVEVEGNTTITDIGEIEYRQVGNMGTAGSFSQTLQLFDFQANAWSNSALQEAPINQVQDRRSIVIEEAPLRFVGANGLLRARYQVRQTGPSAFALWCHNVNQATWVVWPQDE